jgi:hypothetical protein
VRRRERLLVDVAALGPGLAQLASELGDLGLVPLDLLAVRRSQVAQLGLGLLRALLPALLLRLRDDLLLLGRVLLHLADRGVESSRPPLRADQPVQRRRLERVVHRAVTQRDELVLPAHRDLVGDPRAQVLVGEPGGDRLAPETSTARRREPGDLAQRRRQLGHVRQHVRDQGQDPGAHRHRQLLQPHRLAHARPPRASRRPFVRHLDRPLDLSPA